jgi:MSHA biogenesis protein MshJ
MSLSLKMPAVLGGAASKFDRLSLRERGLLFAAAVAVVVTAWNATLMGTLTIKERTLTSEVSALQASLAATSHATANLIESDPTTRALAQLKERQAALDAINARLVAESAGLIPPSQMVQVIRDVLSRQDGLVLVSLKNLPMTSLAPAASAQAQGGSSSAGPASAPEAQATESSSAPAQATAATPVESGPYLHPVEVVVEGSYLDVVNYLHALEALPWHFYWRVLELETKAYPKNRVRIELSTVSMDKEWIGV